MKRWTDEEGAAGAYHEGRLSITAKPSLVGDDGVVIVGIEAPWIAVAEELAEALRQLAERMAENGECFCLRDEPPAPDCPVHKYERLLDRWDTTQQRNES
jgi:hypothetical protein